MRNKDSIIKISVLIFGFSNLIIQLIFLRELINLFTGNELSIGLVLGNWLLINALGSFMAKYLKNKFKNLLWINFLQIFQIFIVVIMLFAADYYRFGVFDYGRELALTDIFLFSFLILFPVSFFSGGLFTIFSQYYSRVSRGNKISDTYSLEATGSIFGCFIFSLILVYFLLPLQIISILLAINLSVGIYILISEKKIIFSIIPVLMIIGVIVVHFILSPDSIMKQNIYKGQNILKIQETPYGQIVITESNGQINMYENGMPTLSSDQLKEIEAFVHFGLSQVEFPEQVLLISGGSSLLLDEIFKYPVKKVDYIEINQQSLKLKQQYFGESKYQKKLEIFNVDPRKFIKRTTNTYDAILVNVPDPINAQINRFYTQDFFLELAGVIKPEGVVEITLSDGGMFLNEKSMNIFSTIYHSLASVFKNVKLFSSTENFFIASQSDINNNPVQRVAESEINTKYFNHSYFDEKGVIEKGQQIISQLDKGYKINSDKKPIAYYLYNKRWLEHQNQALYYFILILSVPCALLFFIRNNYKWPLALSGFTSSSIQIMLILIFQVYFGYIYQMIGIIFLVFMGGLAIGSGFLTKYLIKKNYPIIISQLLFILLLLLILFIFHFKILNSNFFSLLLILLINFIAALITGFQFSLASKKEFLGISHQAASSYSADLLGSSLGALIITSLAIPILGFEIIFIILVGMNLLVSLIFYISK